MMRIRINCHCRLSPLFRDSSRLRRSMILMDSSQARRAVLALSRAAPVLYHLGGLYILTIVQCIDTIRNKSHLAITSTTPSPFTHEAWLDAENSRMNSRPRTMCKSDDTRYSLATSPQTSIPAVWQPAEARKCLRSLGGDRCARVGGAIRGTLAQILILDRVHGLNFGNVCFMP